MVNEEIILSTLQEREKKRLLKQLQTQAEEDGYIPPMPFLWSRKMARPFQYTGGILLGIFLGLFTLLFNFLLFVWVLHLEF